MEWRNRANVEQDVEVSQDEYEPIVGRKSYSSGSGDLSGLANALMSLAVSGLVLHPQGHNIEAERLGVPLHVDYKNMIEKWEPPKDNRVSSRIHGAGFSAQDLASHILSGTKYEVPLRIANMLYKIGYSPSVKANISDNQKTDIGNLRETTGNKYVGPIIGATALADLIKAYRPDDKWDVQFITPEGAPGLQFNYRW